MAMFRVRRAAGARMILPLAPDLYHSLASNRSHGQKRRDAATTQDGETGDVGG
jgi:hypothetical protein